MKIREYANGDRADLVTEAFEPGMPVQHQHCKNAWGIIVSVIDNVVTVLWSVDPNELFAFPNIRRVFPPLHHQELCSIQPMTVPAGGIFYLDYIGGITSGSAK